MMQRVLARAPNAAMRPTPRSASCFRRPGFQGVRLHAPSNGARCRAFFNFNKNNNSSSIGTMSRADYTPQEVEDYFNYMGMLASEGTYDRMEAMLASGNEPVDLLLLMSCSENDTPKVEELLSAGANPTVKDLNGKTAMELCVKEEIKEMLQGALSKA